MGMEGISQISPAEAQRDGCIAACIIQKTSRRRLLYHINPVYNRRTFPLSFCRFLAVDWTGKTYHIITFGPQNGNQQK